LTKNFDQDSAQAMVQRATRAMNQVPIPVICLTHGRNPKCSCDHPEKPKIPMIVMSGDSKESSVSTAPLRLVAVAQKKQ